MKLKKIASLMLAGIMAVSMLAGCKSSNNGGNGNDNDDTTVVPSTSAIVTAFNNGQDEANDVKVNFTSDASLDAALKKAVENDGDYINSAALMADVAKLMGKVQVYNQEAFATSKTEDKNITNNQTITYFGVEAFDSDLYWTAEDVVNDAARKMNDFIANGKTVSGTKYTLDKNNMNATENGVAAEDLPGDKYFAFSYTGTVSLVSAQQEGGSTAYYVAWTITQTATEQTVKA